MDKKVVVLIQPGLPFRRTIRFGEERAREIGAGVVLLGITPEFEVSETMAYANFEIAPYAAIEERMAVDNSGFFQRAVDYCAEMGYAADVLWERGGIEESIRRVVRDRGVKMVVVPTPTKDLHHESFIESLREFAHNMLEQELLCPVISVLAT